MRYSYQDDPALLNGVFDLLDLVFPGLRGVAVRAKALGAPWEAASTPFLAIENGQVLSHVGVIELQLVLLGRQTTVGTVHGVATHPHHRRRGHYRRVMEDLLRHCDRHYQSLILTTEHPEYFEGFDFRTVGEHRFTVDVESSGGTARFRMLDPDLRRDVDILHRLLEGRAPVSEVVGVVNEKAVFCFNEGRRPLPYADDLDLIACMELDGRCLHLYDLVAESIPPLPDILDSLGRPVDEVVTHFSPDRLGAEFDATPQLFDHDGLSYLMARGPFAAEGVPFALPRSART